MFQYEKQMIIRRFIYDKIQQGYTVRKISEDTYEFKIKTTNTDIIEKVHSDNFINEFLQEK